MSHTIVNVSGTSSQVEKQSITIGGARLRPGSSREVSELTPVILDWAERGVLSITPPPGSTKPVAEIPTEEAVEADAPEAPKTDEDENPETPEAPKEDADADEAPEEDAPVEDAPAEETETPEAPAEETTEDEAPAEDAPEEETPEEEAPEEAPADEAPEEEAPEEEETPEDEFSVEDFLAQNATDVVKAISEMDPDQFNDVKSDLYEFEVANKSRATVLKALA